MDRWRPFKRKCLGWQGISLWAACCKRGFSNFRDRPLRPGGYPYAGCHRLRIASVWLSGGTVENYNEDDREPYTKNDIDRIRQDTREEFEKLTEEEFQRVTDAIANHSEAGFANKKRMHDFFEKAQKGQLDK
jgi:hypothetical protein